MVGFGLDYACAHIIILAEISSENLLPIRADFVTERDTLAVKSQVLSENSQSLRLYISQTKRHVRGKTHTTLKFYISST